MVSGKQRGSRLPDKWEEEVPNTETGFHLQVTASPQSQQRSPPLHRFNSTVKQKGSGQFGVTCEGFKLRDNTLNYSARAFHRLSKHRYFILETITIKMGKFSKRFLSTYYTLTLLLALEIVIWHLHSGNTENIKHQKISVAFTLTAHIQKCDRKVHHSRCVLASEREH